MCRRKGVGADILETLIENIKILGHRRIVFKGDQESSTSATQQEVAARRPTMQLENSTKYHSAADGMQYSE